MKEIELLPRYQALGLKFGILNAEDIQSWVDARIMETEKPSNSLLDLAFTNDKKGHDLHNALLEISDAGDNYEIVRALLAKVPDSDLAEIKYCRNFARILEIFSIDCDYDLPKDLYDFNRFDDDYCLAEQGVYLTLEKWHEEFKNFIKSFREDD